MQSIFRLLALLLLLTLLPVCALGEQRVFPAHSAEPFPEDAQLLTLRVCPIQGGDCMIFSWGDTHMMVDGGITLEADKIFQLMKDMGITHIDYFFNTHPHHDHLQGMMKLVEDGVITIGTYITAFEHSYLDPHVCQVAAIRLMREHNVPIIDVSNGMQIHFGNSVMDIIQYSSATDPNNRSAMLMVRYGECSMLLTADIEQKGQSFHARNYDLKADILKCPHHGVNEMNYPFLMEVRPEYAFITNGSADTRAVQQQLNKQHVAWSCASWGVITITCDGQRFLVRQDFSDDMREHCMRNTNMY